VSMKNRKPLVLSLLFLLLVSNAFSQTISGVINSYASVSQIDTTSCIAKLTVDTSNQFLIGDSVLIIQMKGAIIDSTNSINFGNIINYNQCGNYEMASVQSVAGNIITLNEMLSRTYDVNGLVQLVRIPVYTNVDISGTLTCMPWNGTKGGILALIVTGNLTFNSDINISGCGFRGGIISNNPNGICCATSNVGYAFDLYLPSGLWNTAGGAEKGESIAFVSNLLKGGRGHLASGGGGGNKHNSGGGGGGNYSVGGKGGDEMQGCYIGNGGIGGLALAYTPASNKIFLGGGGGSGDINNFVGSPGTNGGGILLLKAQNIIGNNHTIFNNGLHQTIQSTGIGDGSGGGGAGGTVILNQCTFTGNLTIQVNGGNGGDQGPGTTYGCFGPGGGGGAGIVLTDLGLPVNVTIQNQVGLHGQILNPTLPCYGSPYGSTDGAISATSSLTNFIIPKASFQNTTPIAVDLGADTTLCIGQLLQLDSGFPSYTKQWSTSDTSTKINVTTSGVYYVTVSDNANCVSGTDTIKVDFVTGQTFSIPDIQLCENDSVVLQSPIVGSNYLWSNNSVASSLTLKSEGTYWLNVINPPCTNYTDTFKVIATTKPDIAPILNRKLCAINQPIKINTSTNTTVGNFAWSDGSTLNSNSFTEAGNYWVAFSNSCGTDTSFFSIENEGATALFIPSSFTPNGDGQNEVLNVKTGTRAISDYYFAIYNRFGERVFETNNLDLNWNGEYKNSPAPVDTYYWYLKGKTNCGDIFLKGDVTLLR
jgi:gliding motility-associated-like protein